MNPASKTMPTLQKLAPKPVMQPDPKVMQKQALSNITKPTTQPKPQLSQRDAYAKAMYGATKRGGSNGIGVGN